MKRLILLFALASGLYGQCSINSPVLHNAGNTSLVFDNRLKGCVNWVVTYWGVGYSAISVQLEGAPDAGGTPGSWSALTPVTGYNNPSTVTTFAPIAIQNNPPWVRFKLVSNTGSGTITYQVAGASGVSSVKISPPSPGGSCGTLGEDLSGTCAAAVVVGIEGAGIPASATIVGTNASKQVVATSLPSTDIFVGSLGGLPVAVGLTADLSISNAGVATVLGIRGNPVVGVQGATGIGDLAQFSFGPTTNGDCTNFDSSGRTVDAGARCASAPTGTATFAFGSPICDGCCAQGATTIAVGGASIGDTIAIGASPSLGTGINLLGKVTASNTVTVEVCNWTGAAVTPASTTYKAADVRSL